jgi:uncharacterized protein (TIGR03067 family)
MRNLFALLVLALPVFAAPVPKALKKASALDGTWHLTESYSGDTRMQLTDDIRWEINGEQLTVTSTKQAVPNGFVANATRTLKRPDDGGANAIDYTIIPPDGGQISFRPAVFEVDGDTLKMSLSATHNGPRPADCKPANGAMLYVLKRAESK